MMMHEYNSYAVATCFFDDSFSLQLGPAFTENAQFLTVANKLAATCSRHVAFVEAAASRIGLPERMRECLFNPLTMYAFGHQDIVSTVLIDDFDPFLRLTTEIDLPMEQVILSFAPNLKSLGIRMHEETTDDEVPFPFVQPHELFDARTNDQAWHTHSIEQSLPLFAYGRLKLGGLCVMPNGLDWLPHILSALALRIRTVQENLYVYACDSGESCGMSPKVVADCKVAFLESQGSEELLVVIASSHSGVTSAFLQAIRSLTVGDVLGASPCRETVSQMLNNSQVHTETVRLASRHSSVGSNDEELRENHVFSTSYSTLCVSHCDENANNVMGQVEAYARVELNAGHMAEFESTLRTTMKSTDWCMCVPSQSTQSREYHRTMFGRYDYDLSFTWADDVEIECVSFSVMLKRLRCLQDTIRTMGDRHGETGILDISTSLVLPFPENAWSAPTPTEQHKPLILTLASIKQHLFRNGDLNLHDLRTAMRQTHMPAQLRRTIEHLFQNLASWLGNTIYFEAVLDLYDIYEVLYGIVTEELPREAATRMRPRDVFTVRTLDALASILDALRDSTVHRVTVLPNAELPDWSIDIRGGLNQLIAAVDVPLKCGVGLLKWYKHLGIEDAPIASIAGICRLTFQPRTSLSHMKFRDDGPQVAVITTNVSHVLNPAEYLDYLHEAAHLLLPTAAKRSGAKWLEAVAVDDREVPATGRFHEVFADSIVALFVFQGEADLFATYQFSQFNGHVASSSEDAEEHIAKYVEVAMRCFIVADGIEQLANGREVFGSWDKLRSDDGHLEERRLTNRFVAFAKKYLSLYSAIACADGYESIEYALLEYAEQRFRKLIAPLADHWVQMWKSVSSVVDSYRETHFPWNDPEADDAFNLALDACYETRSVSLRSEFSKRYGSESAVELDQLVVLCGSVRRYVRALYEEINIERHVHVERDAKGEPTWGRGDYSRALLDPAYPGVFLLAPSLRKKRLEYQIVTMRLVWSLSTELRSRRFVRLAEVAPVVSTVK